jgi:hypothetical protein
LEEQDRLSPAKKQNSAGRRRKMKTTVKGILVVLAMVGMLVAMAPQMAFSAPPSPLQLFILEFRLERQYDAAAADFKRYMDEWLATGNPDAFRRYHDALNRMGIAKQSLADLGIDYPPPSGKGGTRPKIDNPPRKMPLLTWPHAQGFFRTKLDLGALVKGASKPLVKIDQPIVLCPLPKIPSPPPTVKVDSPAQICTAPSFSGPIRIAPVGAVRPVGATLMHGRITGRK